MKLNVFIAASVLAAAVAAPALAQPPGPMTPEQREARFTAGDTNKDGKLDKKEWLASIPAGMKANATDDQLEQMWSSRIDADGDGFITKDQFLALKMGPRPGGN
ncbi:MAG: EF-hand domain-containing protein [Hyphomonadaceae bacterium]